MGAFTFTRMYPNLIPPMRADRAALGCMPISAYQYCEAMRVASCHGWYIFPPQDIALRFDGCDIFAETEGGAWEPVSYAHLPGHIEYWNQRCPEGYEGLAPPYLRVLPTPGVLQVWSGWLIEACEGWSALVRPIANGPRSNLLHIFEAAIEVDHFCPCPLFTNLQLKAIDVTIRLSRCNPMFQVQPVLNESYGAIATTLRDGFGADGGMTPDDWAGFRKTVRVNRSDESHRLGDYGAQVRKRAKAGEGA